MREIEAKAVLRDREGMVKKLTEMGCIFSDPVRQDDTVFFPAGVSHPAPAGTNVLRIRQEKDRAFLTLKQPRGDLDKYEREVEIVAAEAMLDIVMLLGFYIFSHSIKTRVRAQWEEMEICLDTVEGLGDFIEVERMVADDTDGEAIADELFVFLQTLGITSEDRVTRGYDVLLHERGSKLAGGSL